MSEYAPCTPPLGSLQLLEKEAETSHGCQTLHTALPTVCNVIIIVIVIFPENVAWPKNFGLLPLVSSFFMFTHSHILLFSILTFQFFTFTYFHTASYNMQVVLQIHKGIKWQKKPLAIPNWRSNRPLYISGSFCQVLHISRCHHWQQQHTVGQGLVDQGTWVHPNIQDYLLYQY